jgi:hypothetical protein
MFLYFSETQTRRNDFRGPDVFVVLDTERRERKAWVVWEEGGRTPDVVIELLSDSTRKTDRGDKKRIYARTLRVGEYFLFDPFSKELEGYTLDPLKGEYVPKVPDARGWLLSEQLGLHLGAVESEPWGRRDHWLRWLDPTGRALPHSSEALRSETERANRESERANREAERAAALASELAELRGQKG